MQTLSSIVELSRGATWRPGRGERPYLLAENGRAWPAGTAYVEFYDTTGNTIAHIEATSVTPEFISFTADSSQVDKIPKGANFEIYLTTSDGVFKIRYGKVVRKEAEFSTAPAKVTKSVALNFTDTFPTLGLRTDWKAVTGIAKVYDNTGASLPFGVSANAELLSSKAAIRWGTPLNSDTVKSHVVLLNRGQGQCTAIICADQRFSVGYGVQFDSATNKLNLGVITGPTTLTFKATAVSHTVVNNEDFYIAYDDLTHTLAVYQGTSLNPLQTWVDSTGIVPHGPGYRYSGFSFNTGFLFSPGIEVAGWQATDT